MDDGNVTTGRSTARPADGQAGPSRRGDGAAAPPTGGGSAAADPGGGAFAAFTRATGRSLESGEDKPRYRRYQLELIEPYLGSTALEVGAGLGELAAHFTGLRRLVVTDVDPDAVRAMRERFADRPEVEAVTLDLDGEWTIDEPVESVVAVNVLEHIDDDAAALRSLARLAVPGGRLILWTPGYQQLYGDFDRRVGHVRRYTPSTLRAAAERAGLTVTKSRPVNLLGGLAWWLAVRRGGCGTPDPRLAAAYDRVVVPTTRVLERLIPPPFGQSILCVARTPPGLAEVRGGESHRA